jgi:succinate dehydrogenase/fumarate reductase cytochrome b subunit
VAVVDNKVTARPALVAEMVRALRAVRQVLLVALVAMAAMVASASAGVHQTFQDLQQYIELKPPLSTSQ